MRVLVTGAAGFAASHLIEHLLERGGAEIFGTVRWRSKTENIEHLRPRMTLLECDIKDATSVRRAVDESRPDWIFHLAAQSYVPTSWHAPAETLATNIQGTLNVLEAVRGAKLASRIQVAGSSEEYGLTLPGELPLRESSPLRPMSPYAVSKVAQDLLAFQYHRSYGLATVRTRAFNHTGPRRGDVFVTSNLCLQVSRMEAGSQPPVLLTGNLDAVRDFTDVRDMVRAYALALEKGRAGEVYNICSGRGVAIRDIVEMLRGLSKVPFELRTDPARLRPSDVPVLVGCADLFHRETGWEPRIPFDRTVRDLLEYWRSRKDGR
ncbi:MAG: GDP-mannose 4,6-dehydratase [Planctomycetes bacterium]|nr:GDP-mannose 4,6-dehydratase [Planctomycetota bacterium]